MSRFNISPSGIYYCFDVGFSSLLGQAGLKEGSMDAWGFAEYTSTSSLPSTPISPPTISTPGWTQGAHRQKGDPPPSSAQTLTNKSLIIFNVYDKDYDASKNPTKLLGVTFSFANKAGGEGYDQSPVTFAANDMPPGQTGLVNPIHQDLIGEPLTGWTSTATGDSNVAVWSFPGQWVKSASSDDTDFLSYAIYQLSNSPARFRCSVAVTVQMPNLSTKIFMEDPEMDVEAGG